MLFHGLLEKPTAGNQVPERLCIYRTHVSCKSDSNPSLLELCGKEKNRQRVGGMGRVSRLLALAFMIEEYNVHPARDSTLMVGPCLWGVDEMEGLFSPSFLYFTITYQRNNMICFQHLVSGL